jgi:hypothetical protein
MSTEKKNWRSLEVSMRRYYDFQHFDSLTHFLQDDDVIPDGSDGNYIYTKKLMMMKIWIDNVN